MGIYKMRKNLFVVFFLTTIQNMCILAKKQEINCTVLKDQCLSMSKFPNSCFSPHKHELGIKHCPVMKTVEMRVSCECGYHYREEELDDPGFIVGVVSCCVFAVLLILCLLCCIGN